MSESRLGALLLARTGNLHTQFFRFLIAGGLVVPIDVGLFYLMSVSMGVNYLVANTLSFLISMSVEYFISREWVFNRENHQLGRDYLLFLAGSALCLAIGNAVLLAAVDYSLLKPLPMQLDAEQELLLAKGISIVLIAIFDFWFKKRFVFGHEAK